MNFRKPCNKFRVRFVLLGRGHTTLLGDAVPILYPRAKTKAPHFSASWPHFSPSKPSPGELLPISGHFVASFYYINSSCISICSMLSFFVLSRTPFEIFDRTFPGAALPAPGPIASGLLRMQRQLSAISISNQIINLHTPYSLSCRLLQAKPFPFFALRTLAKKQGGVPLSAFYKILPSCVFTNLRGYAASVATGTPTGLQRFRNAARCKVSRNASVPPCRVVDRAPVRLPKRR